MKDKLTLIWLYQNSKIQHLPMFLLILGNIALAGCGVLFALGCLYVIDGVSTGNIHTLILRGLLLFLVIVLQLALRIFCQSIEVRVQGKLEMDFKTKLLGEILQKDYIQASRYHSGELMNRLTSDITFVSQGVTSLLPNLVGLLTKLISAFTVLYILDHTFALIFAVSGLLLFFTAKLFREKLKHLHKNVQEKEGLVRSFMQEVLESIIVIKVFAVEHNMKNKAEGLQQENYKAKKAKNDISILANSGFTFIFGVGYLFALLWSSFGLMAKTVSFGTFTAILQLVGQVQTPFSGLTGLFPKLYGVIASAERIIELEDLPNEIEINKKDLNVLDVYEYMQSIVFEDVSFSYEREIVLGHVDLTIEKGDFTLVFGISGIGKSTLLKLLLGVFTPDIGAISIKLNNGDPIPIDRHTRKFFAYVPQGNLLLSGTIRENITFVNPNATDAEIMAATQVSCAAEFIEMLPYGLETVIGEKGQGLSEGQVQRIAIARAILSGAPILLLDEATSALDEVTETRLLNNIKDMTDRTCMIISHKKAAVSVCNKEIHIENTVAKTMERSKNIDYHSA